MKLAIVGSRTFDNYTKALCAFHRHFPNGEITEIVSGGARGADAIGKAIAKQLNLKYTEFLPDWAKFGRSAGFKRNVQIVEASDVVLAFWDGKSKGTKHSIDLGKQQNKKVIIELFS